MIDEAVSMRKSQAYMETTARREALFEVESMVYDLEEMRDQLVLYRDQLVPQSRALLQSATRNYEADMVDYREVAMARTQTLKNELELIARRYGYEKRLVQLERAVGVPLSQPIPLKLGDPL